MELGQQVFIELFNLHIKLRSIVSAKPVCMMQEISNCANFKVTYLSAVYMEMEQQVLIALLTCISSCDAP